MRVAVTDLVGRPGATRHLATVVDRSEVEGSWGPADEAVRSSIEVDVELEMLAEGLLVRGSIGFEFEVECARCLAPLARDSSITVTELFAEPERVDDVEPGYELVDGAIDLEPLLRDTVVTALPVRLLCREDCLGLCPTCGTDLNVADCGHAAVPAPDPRWAALRTIELPPG